MKRVGLFVVLVAFVGMLSCTKKSSQDSSSTGKVLKYSENGSPTTLDPTQGSTVYSSLVLKNLYDTPYEYKYLKRPYEIKPNLAEALPQVSADGLTYTFKIRQGVHYIDDECFEGGKGREVVAEDFVYGIKRHFDPKNRSQVAWLYRGRMVGLDQWKEKGANYDQPIEGLKALDKYTVQIKLIKPYPQLIYTLAMSSASFVPREAVEKYGREFGVHPVGSGPFKLVSFNTKKVILERNEKFRKIKINLADEGYDEATHGFTGLKQIDGKTTPLVDRIEISFMNEQIPRWNSFTKGNEIQVASVPIELLEQVTVSKNPVKLKPEYDKYKMLSSREFGLVYSNFNMDNPDFGYNKDPKRNARNKALRCAIRKGFNWDERIERFYYGIGKAYPGVIPPGIEGYDESLSREAITNDIAGAKKMLKDNGWTAANLPVMEYAGVSSVRQKQFFEQFRGWMKKIGYPTNKIKFKSFATFGDYSKAMKQRKVMFHGLGWAIDYPDGENILQLYYGPNGSPGSNTSNFANKAYDKLYEQAAVMQPGPKRAELYKKMNQILLEECVVVAGFSRTGIYLWHDNVLMYPDRDVLGGFTLKYMDVL